MDDDFRLRRIFLDIGNQPVRMRMKRFRLKALRTRLLDRNVIPRLCREQILETFLARIRAANRVIGIGFKGIRMPHVALKVATANHRVRGNHTVARRFNDVAKIVERIRRKTVADCKNFERLAFCLGISAKSKNHQNRKHRIKAHPLSPSLERLRA